MFTSCELFLFSSCAGTAVMGDAQLRIKRLLRPRSASVCYKEGGSRCEKEFMLTRLFCVYIGMKFRLGEFLSDLCEVDLHLLWSPWLRLAKLRQHKPRDFGLVEPITRMSSAYIASPSKPFRICVF